MEVKEVKKLYSTMFKLSAFNIITSFNLCNFS